MDKKPKINSWGEMEWIHRSKIDIKNAQALIPSLRKDGPDMVWESGEEQYFITKKDEVFILRIMPDGNLYYWDLKWNPLEI